MKKITRINKNEVDIDGSLYRKVEEPKPEFKVGDWVFLCYNCRRILRIVGDHFYLEYGYGNEKTYEGESSFRSVDLRLATKEEIETHLKKVCKEKYKNGNKLSGAKYDSCFIYDELESVDYNYKDDILSSRGMFLYYKGKWAIIIPEKKALPKTKEEFVGFLVSFETRYHNGTGLSINEFLKEYED